MVLRWRLGWPHTGSSLEGYDDRGFMAATLIRNPDGWRAYVGGDPVDRFPYGRAEEPMHVAQLANALRPPPKPAPRRWARVPNRPD